MNGVYKQLHRSVDELWKWIAEKVFVRFTFDIPAEELRPFVEKRTLVFVLVDGGFFEWLILSSWGRSRGYLATSVANRMRVLLVSAPTIFLRRLFGRVSYAEAFLDPRQTGPRLLFVRTRERSRPFVPTPSEKLLAELYGRMSQAVEGPRPDDLVFVPLFFLWRKHSRGGARTPSEYLLGLSSRPNWVGKFWYLLRKRHDSTVRALGAFRSLSKAQDPSVGSDVAISVDGESEAMRVAKSARRRLLVVHNQELRVVLGPRYHTPGAVKDLLMRHPDVQAAIDQVAREENVPREKIVRRAFANFTEILSDYQYRFIEVMYVVLTWFFTKVFDGFVSRDEDLVAVREVAKTKPVIFMPCHRSHLDYLVIPYLLFLRDMVTPHIAAGINLNFWPLGRFMRRGGAFFIRRSFRGDVLYTACLRRYLEYLIINRHSVMFFIEGTRSRSGKMLPPAYGLLKMSLGAMEKHEVEDVAFIPVAICYDEVPEQGAYAKEVRGSQKVKESARELLKSRSILRRKFGKVYVRVAKPILARRFFDEQRAEQVDDKLALQKLAFRICKDINDVMPITAKSIVCTTLLTHIDGQLTLQDILRLSLDVANYVLWSGMALSTPLESGFRQSVEQTIRRLQRSGALNVQDTALRTFGCEPHRRPLLNYYKNNALHCLAEPSLLLLAFVVAYRKRPEATAEAVVEDTLDWALWLRNVLKFEFFFEPTRPFLDGMKRRFKFFFGDHPWESRKANDLVIALKQRFEQWNDLSVYLRMLGDLLESYAVLARFMAESPGAAYEPKQWAQRALKYGEMLLAQGEIAFPESLSVQNYTNALKLFENLESVGRKTEGSNELAVRDASALEKLAEELESFGEVLQRKPEAALLPETSLELRH